MILYPPRLTPETERLPRSFLFSPLFTNVVEGVFSEVRQLGVLGSSHSPGPIPLWVQERISSAARVYYPDLLDLLII